MNFCPICHHPVEDHVDFEGCLVEVGKERMCRCTITRDELNAVVEYWIIMEADKMTKDFHWGKWNITIWLNQYWTYSYIATRGTDYRDGIVEAKTIDLAYWQVVNKL